MTFSCNSYLFQIYGCYQKEISSYLQFIVYDLDQKSFHAGFRI